MGSVKSPRAPKPSADDFQGVVPGAGTNALSVVPSSQVLLLLFVFLWRYRALPRGSPWPWSAFGDGNHASSAVFLSRGINSAMGVRAPNAAPITHGTRACAFCVPPQVRVAQQYSCCDGASPFSRTCSYPPLPDHAVTVGLRCGTADPQTLFSGHEVTVGLGCGQDNI